MTAVNAVIVSESSSTRSRVIPNSSPSDSERTDRPTDRQTDSANADRLVEQFLLVRA